MELTREELISMMQEVADKAVNGALTHMIESKQGQQAQHLENCTGDTQNCLLSETKGAGQMAYKYREQIGRAS